MNAGLLMRVIEHKLGFSIFARDREIGFNDNCSGGVMSAKVLPSQEQKVAQVSRASDKY